MKRKFLSLLLAMAMLCSMFVPAMAAEETAVTPYAIPDVKGKLVILHTNDTHGADVAEEGKVIGTAGVAQLKKDFEAAGAEVLLFSAGDAIMGQPLVSLSKGANAIEFMNAAGYDAMTVGNHEMDFGYENLKTLAKAAKFPILGADVLDAKTSKPVFDANKIFTTASGLKVGVFGLATPETLTKADATKMPGITFPQTEELFKLAQAQVDQLKKNGAQLIVCLGHLGVDKESEGNRSIDLCKKVNGIDLFVDGHSHSTTEQIVKAIGGDTNVVNSTKIVSTGTALANVGVVIYDKTAKSLTDSLVSAASYTKVDETVAKLVNDKNAEVDKELSVVFAKSEVTLNGDKAPGNRTMETNLGNFAADALLWQARKNLGEDKVDASLTNGGGIRAAIPAGDVNMKTMKTVFPFGNTVATISVTGEQLLEALEAATYCTPEAVGAFPQVSGIKFSINTAVPYENGAQYPGSTYYAPAKPGSRVTIMTVNDKVFDAKATYTIATNDFTAKGNDTYGVFKAVGSWKDTAMPLEDALVNYTKDVLKGTITAEKYGKTDDRILIIPADVKPGVWYTDAVYYVLAEGIMKGTASNSFNPSGTVSRATVYQMLYNMEGKPAVAEDVVVADVEGKWYSSAVRWAKSVNIFAGESFGEDATIVRAEIAQIIADYADYKGITVDESGMAMKEAKDYASIPAEFLDGMTFCYYAGAMTGNQSGLLLPNDSLTRDQLAQVMYNFAKIPVPAEKAA